MNAIATRYPRYGHLAGPVVMIGFGSIGRGTLPLILRHFDVDPADIVVVAPDTSNDGLLGQLGIRKVTAPITADNYRELLTPLLRTGDRNHAFCVNLSVVTSSVAILALCRQLEALYLDTVIEPWPGFYDDAAGIDELGVLLYGHQANAYWFGSRLSIEETRSLAPYQTATGLQVTSAVLAAMVWALEHPGEGFVEADDIDFRRCLEVQRPYLGPVEGHFTDWTPLSARSPLFPDDIDDSDPWQFRHVLVH